MTTLAARDIVEDPNNNLTVYQRVGRKPGVEAVVVAFMRDLFYDPRLNAFFAGGSASSNVNASPRGQRSSGQSSANSCVSPCVKAIPP